MLDWVWAIVVAIFLAAVVVVFALLWRSGNGHNGLKDELHERVASLEKEVERLSLELRSSRGRGNV